MRVWKFSKIIISSEYHINTYLYITVITLFDFKFLILFICKPKYYSDIPFMFPINNSYYIPMSKIMWNIKFSDGIIIGAYPEEIIPSEMKENGCLLSEIK